MGVSNSKLESFGAVSFDGEYAKVKVNPKIYSLAVVQSAAFSLLDKAYFFIDGDSKDGFVVEIWPKKASGEKNLLEVGKFFNDELLNYAVFTMQSEANKPLRETILRAAFFSANQPTLQTTPSKVASEDTSCECKDGEDFDPMEIARPWTPDKAPKR